MVVRFQIVQAIAEDISWIAELEAKTYSPTDAISESVLWGWHSKNPFGFSVIENERGERIGHLDVLPLIPDLAKPFLEGAIFEREISPDWIVPINDHTSFRDLYVESIIVKRQPGLASRLALLQVFEQFEILVQRICDPAMVQNVYAIEASAAGKKLMLHLGFERCEMQTPRRDGHDLYKSSIDTIRSRLVPRA